MLYWEKITVFLEKCTTYNCTPWVECRFYDFQHACISFHGAATPSGPRPLHCWIFAITLRHTIRGRTPLDECSARRRDLYLKTHNTHNRQTSVPPVGLNPAIPVSERPHTHALDRENTGMTLPRFGRTFLSLIYVLYIHVTKYTYNRISTFAEKVTREKYGLVAWLPSIPVQHFMLSVHCSGPSLSR